MAKLKMQGATPEHGAPSLCRSCRHSVVVQGHAQSEEIIACGVISRGEGRERVPFPVTFCTSYDNKNHASIYEMKQIAWTLRTDGGARKIGFVSPAQLAAEAEEERKRAAATGAPTPPAADDDPLWDPIKKEKVW